MNKTKNVILVVISDFILFSIIIFSVYKMLTTEPGSLINSIFMAIIVISIPIIFFSTYLLVAGDKYDFNESEFEDELMKDEEDLKNRDNINNGDVSLDSKEKKEECYEKL